MRSRTRGGSGGPWAWIATLGLALHSLAGPPLAAQTNLETNAGVQFNFGAPGAANLALGGAFVGLAFDGTAAYTNPAGLTTLIDPELWAELRHRRYTHVFTDEGRIEGQEPTFEGADDLAGLRRGEASDSVLGPSFLSYVHPGRHGTVALYTHRLLDFEADFSTQGPFLDRVRSTNPQGFGILGESTGRLPALRNRMSAEIDSYGVAAARALGGGLSLGANLSYHRFRMDSRAERYVPELLVDEPDFDSGELRSVQTQEGTDDDWSFALGTLWQSPSRVWSLGAVYRKGPAFEFRAGSRSALDSTSPLFFEPRSQPAVFHVPDFYGVGLAWRPSTRLTLAIDYDRVEYSDLLDDVVDIFALADLAGVDSELGSFRIDDADEIHVGVELWFPGSNRATSLRLGAWYDPDHTLRFEGENRSFGTVFRGGDDEVHLTLGVGVAGPVLQVDIGLDYSDRSSVASLSVGRRF